MAYFVSVLRQRIANFEAKPAPAGGRRTAAASDPAPLAGSGDDRHLHQRPAQEPARPQRVHGPGMPRHAGALRRDLRRLADHRHRPAARGGIGAGGHQHGAQPGIERYQPGAGGGGPAGGAIAARGGDRDACARRRKWSPSSRWRPNCRRCTAAGPTYWGPTCATCAWRSSTKRSRSIWRRANERYGDASGCRGPDCVRGRIHRRARASGAGPHLRPVRRGAGAHLPGVHAVRKSGWRAGRAGLALSARQARARRRSS